MHHFRAVPIMATLPLAEAAQLVVEQMLQTITHSFLQDWQLRLANLPTHSGGLGVPYLPTLCCLARYASLWQLQQPTDTGRFALYFADLEAPTILSTLQREHHFSLATQIADI
eukprot:4150613-Amphidinium_carterae.1